MTDGTATNRTAQIGYASATATQFYYQDAGVIQANFNVNGSAANTSMKLASTYQANRFVGAVNGTVSVGDTSGTLNSGVNRIDIGHVANIAQAESTIKNVRIWTTALTDAQLQSITT
jgi:hypothetical protein